MVIQDLKYNEEDARHVAMLCFDTDEELFVKTKSDFVEIRTVKGTFQIQDNGRIWLGEKTADGLESADIPNCWQIVQYLIEKGYKLSSFPILKEYKSLERFEITGKGLVFVVESEIERSRHAGDIMGRPVQIDGGIYIVKGVESTCADRIMKGDRIGLLVKGNVILKTKKA